MDQDGSESPWRNRMFNVVLQVVKIVKEKPRKHDLPSGFFKNLDFFEHVGFFEDLKSSYPGVQVIQDSRYKKITLKGRGDAFFGACNKCEGVLHKIEAKPIALGESRIWEIIAKNNESLNSLLKSMGIKAKVELDGSGNMVNIKAMDAVHWRRALNALAEAIPPCTGNISTDLPQFWNPQPLGVMAHLVNLRQSTIEYQEIFNLFNNKGGNACYVTKIERIQNPVLYKAYTVKKHSMAVMANEKRLFHGTDTKHINAINANNFSRSFHGINGSLYGNGVYFARDAAYSVRYCTSDFGHDLQMYVVKVLVGMYTEGQQGMKAPPSRNDPNNPGLQFDSLVNNVSDPSIFVLFQDNQCYPEYLISFGKMTY